MKTTGITTLDHAPLAAAEWLDLLQDDSGWKDRGRAPLLLRETLHAVRDFLTVQNVAGLSAQVPLMIRSTFFNGLVPARTPTRQRSAEDFPIGVMRPFSDDLPVQPEVAVAAVLSILRCHICLRECGQVLQAIRMPLRALWL